MKNKESGQQKRGISIRWIILAICLIPLLVLSVAITVAAVVNMRQGIENEDTESLLTLANAARASIGRMYNGEYHLEGDILYKGNTDLSKEQEMLDSLVAHSDDNIVITYGDTPYFTTVRDGSGNPLIGMKIDNREMLEAVIERAENYVSTKEDVNGEPMSFS